MISIARASARSCELLAAHVWLKRVSVDTINDLLPGTSLSPKDIHEVKTAVLIEAKSQTQLLN